MSDFGKIVDYYIINQNPPKDINCVYSEKTKINQLVDKFCELKNIPKSILLTKKVNLNYTADGSKLKSLNINLDGHDLGLKEYVNQYEQK
jgi:hypothetical protein